MKTYDVVVIGSGVASGIVFKALALGLKVALVEGARLGGTCLNVGCVPSKTFLYPADVVTEIRSADRLGIAVELKRIRYDTIRKRVRKIISEGRGYLHQAVLDSKNLDFYHEKAHFTEPYALEVGGETITGRKIFIASGARPMIPPIKGLDQIGYLTNESIPDLMKPPESLAIMGGGYIGVEYGHFFAAMGTRVVILQKGDRILPAEEPEISELMQQELSRRMKILTGAEVIECRKTSGGVSVLYKTGKSGPAKAITTERILVASGRKSNADRLEVEKAGIMTDERHFIKVNDFLETNRRNIWALGDAIGKQMFTHAGDKEAEIAWHNASRGSRSRKLKMDFNAVPHAVFAHPPIASIGMTEEKAGREHEILVGTAMYSEIVKGDAMVEKNGFAKAVVAKKSGKILGFHIIGPAAPELIQEVAYAMARGATAASIRSTMHIFPSLSELVPEALNHLK